MTLGQIGGMGRDLVGNDADFDIVAVGEPQMLLGRHIAHMAVPNQPIIAAPMPLVM